MVSEKKKITNARWDAAHMATLGCRVKKEDADAFRALAASRGRTVSAALAEYVKGGSSAPAPSAPPGADPSGISPETIRAAEQAAKEAGETVDAYIARAVTQQAQRDAIARRLAGQYQEARQRQQARDERDNKE